MFEPYKIEFNLFIETLNMGNFRERLELVKGLEPPTC